MNTTHVSSAKKKARDFSADRSYGDFDEIFEAAANELNIGLSRIRTITVRSIKKYPHFAVAVVGAIAIAGLLLSKTEASSAIKH